MKRITVGFIGQGFVGKSYADDFEERGYQVVRYSLDKVYINNRDKIKNCSVVFVAVPTPTINKIFILKHLHSALENLSTNTIVVIKSTVPPGTTKRLQKSYRRLTLIHSPEFLTEKNAAYDAKHPLRNIIGLPSQSKKHRQAAQLLHKILPKAPYFSLVDSTEAELIKYAGNCFLFSKVIFFNLLYDLTISSKLNWEKVREAVANDIRIGHSHTEAIIRGKRGAGGHCFIKDFEVFRNSYRKFTNDVEGQLMLNSLALKNIKLLHQSKKDLDLLKAVYGNGYDKITL